MPEDVLDGAVERPDAHTDQGERAEPTNWFFYILGLSLQIFLWSLLFLAIVVAVAVGNKLTEFRYVGF